MIATFLLLTSKSAGINLSAGYLTGAIIGLLILAYLFYSLVKPEKF
jgi:K+-transporting ATPase KdpF subunit